MSGSVSGSIDLKESADDNVGSTTSCENKILNETDEKEKECTEEQIPNDSGGGKLDVDGDSSEKYDYTTSLMQSSIYHDREIIVDPEIIEKLTNGVVEQFIPSLKKTQATISQIKDSQQVLIDTVEQENSKFSDCQTIPRLEATMAKAKIYHAKLLKLRKDMTALHEKSAKLKRRAVKLQQQKQKDEMNRAQIMEKEYEREKMLTARVAKEEPPGP